MIDYVNVHRAERHLTPREEKTIDGIAYRITRSVDRGFFVKRIVIDAHTRATQLLTTVG